MPTESMPSRRPWNQLKGQIKERWGQLTDDDLQISGGNIDQFVGRIQQKTGEGREAIEKFLSELTSREAPTLSQATEVAREFAQQAGERFRDAFGQVADQARERYEMAEDVVRREPVPSVAVAAGVGLATGLLLGAGRSRAAARMAVGAIAAAAAGLVLNDVVARARVDWGLNRKDFGRLIGYSERIIADWERGKTISEPALRRVIEAARLHQRLVESLAGIVQPDVLPRWLTTPNPAFENSTPLQVIERGEVDRIWNMAFELGSGMPV